MRIGLYTPKSRADKRTLKTTDIKHIDAANVAELTKALEGAGAKQVGKFFRDRAGAGHLEGGMHPPADLTNEDFAWLGEKPAEYQIRGLFYTTD